jgi:type 1 glutamine amidotransferase
MLKRITSKLALCSCLLLLSLNSYAEQFNVLLFTMTQGFHHQSQLEGVAAMREMGKKHFFNVDWQEDPSVFNDENLKKFQVIIFLSTTGDLFKPEQKAAMERFIKSGKGFVGIHSASDTEYSWEWYTKLVGHSFHIHPTIQTAELQVLDRKFPGLERMPDRLLWTEEWYEFGPENTKGLNYILAVDEKTFDPKVNWGSKKGEGMGKFHPVAWYHNYDGGRSFYTALGHTPAHYSDSFYLEHVYGGIYWAATGKGLKTK